VNAAAIGGLVALNLLFVLAGTGVTAAIAGFGGRRDIGPGPSVAYLCGVAATTLLVLNLAILGVRPSFGSVLACGLGLAVCGLVIAHVRGVDLRRPRYEPAPKAAAFQPLAMVFAACVGLVLAALLTASWARGVANFDAWTFWVPKALVLHYFGLDVPLLIGVIKSSTQPLFTPALLASNFAFVGSANTMVASVQYVLLLGGFILATARLLTRVAPSVIVWPALLLLVVTPHVIRRAMAPEADLPWEYFFVLAVLCLVLWGVYHRPGSLPLAALFLAASVACKREGAIGFVAIALALPFLVDRATRTRWRGPLAGGLFVLAAALPWWIWIQVEAHQEGTSTILAVCAALAVSTAVWWGLRFGRRLAILLPVVPFVIGVPAWQLLHSSATVRFSNLPNALSVATWDLFDPTLWLLASVAGLGLLVLALFTARDRRVAAFVLLISLILFASFTARLLAFPLDWYDQRSLTPTVRNVAALVLLWLVCAPIMVTQLLPGKLVRRVTERGRLMRGAWSRSNVVVPMLWALLPALVFLVVAIGRGDLALATQLCAKPVVSPDDAAFVFGHTRTYEEARTLQTRVMSVGFRNTIIDVDPCAGFRVLTPHVTERVAREQQAEAKPVGIYGTIEQT
jgi:ABC-type multidrug transport system fused ATPase/permease subunit